jgi:adenylate cyclase
VIAERLSGRSETAGSERELLDMMSKGLGYAEIAEALGTTQEAVDRQVTDLFSRLAGDGVGGSNIVDEFKRLHAAVVHQASSSRTLASFVPQQLVDRLVAQPDTAIEPQEVEVSVLFSDIRGFSTLAERMSARDVADIVGRHLSAMAEVVLAHGGTIDKFQGDAVMAIFGAPNPQPDHADRALRCAISMQARQTELNRDGWGADVTELGVGIGVNTGLVIAGTVGGGGRLEYTVVGDAVNIAQRLQSEAEGGEVVASATTVAAAPGVAAESIGPRHVKGREEQVEVFRVVLG